ncbi:MAG: hypothetical protein ABR567_10235 [Myxococcales bacterium]|nr:hypothetical protein [Myxococcales bacterium]
MKTMIALSMLMVFACATPAGTLRTSTESFAGAWHGVLAKGEVRSPADFRFSAGEGSYRGFYWGAALTPIPLAHVQLGQSVHFEIPQMGVFDGTSDGETIEGSFRDSTGEGSFTLAKQLDGDDPRNVTF